MPLHPVIGRPAEVQAAGASLAAHQATRELPTAGPWAKFAAVAKKGEEAEGAAAAATTIAAADAPSEQQQQQQASSAPSADFDSVPAVLVQGLDFSYPDIGEGGKITLAASKRTSIAIEISSAARARARESVVAGAWRALSLNLDDRSRAPSSFLSPPSKKKKRQPPPDGRPLPGVPPVVVDMHLSLPTGSRCLLLGANGAGKTTLLKVLGGKHLVPRAAVSVLGGRSPFHDTGLASSGALSYLGGNWERDVAFAGFSVPLAADFGAGEMLERASAPGAEGAARREKLVEVLDIDPEWRMHRVSDGQRRRVQIAMGEYFFAFLSGGSSLARGLFSSSKGEKKKRKKNPREWEKTKKTHLSFSLSSPAPFSLSHPPSLSPPPTSQACSSPLTSFSSTR